jgi:hypothetical protein
VQLALLVEQEQLVLKEQRVSLVKGVLLDLQVSRVSLVLRAQLVSLVEQVEQEQLVLKEQLVSLDLQVRGV